MSKSRKGEVGEGIEGCFEAGEGGHRRMLLAVGMGGQQGRGSKGNHGRRIPVS